MNIPECPQCGNYSFYVDFMALCDGHIDMETGEFQDENTYLDDIKVETIVCSECQADVDPLSEQGLLIKKKIQHPGD